MPDYSILPSLCDKLNISITELLSGEKLEANEYQQKLEKSMILNMGLLKKKMLKYIKRLALITIPLIGILGLSFIVFLVYTKISQIKVVFPKENINSKICKQENWIHVLIESNTGESFQTIIDQKNGNYSYKIYYPQNKAISTMSHILLPDQVSSITIYDDIIYEKGMELDECNFDS